MQGDDQCTVLQGIKSFMAGKLTFREQRKSFGYAIHGILWFFRNTLNSRIHLGAALSVILLGLLCDLSGIEWVAISVGIGLVFITELINSAIEELCDFITNERHDAIGRVKDMAAGAVLTASLLAVVIGMIVFLPKLLGFFTTD